MKRSLFLLFVALSLSGTCPAQTGPSSQIRVCVIDNADEVRLVVKKPFEISNLHSDDLLKEGPSLNAKVSATKGGILVSGDELKTNGIRVKASQGGNVFVNNKAFRGSVDILRSDNLKLIVVNHLGVEEYLYGVLYHEVSPRWPIEALKAQAITARTYALCQKDKNKNMDYDLRNDIYSQVYGGRTSERWTTNRAVDMTRGLVLAYQGVPFPSYFHATCAGHTEDSSNLWNIDMPPLDGVECGYCKNSPHYKWSCEIPLEKIKERLNIAGYKIEQVASIKILSRNSSDRVDKLEIADDKGTSIIVPAKDFRITLDPNVVRSANFELEIKNGRAVFRGSGWGHGVGMCQWGAYGMAKTGKKAEEILKYYYPGASIGTLYHE